MGLACSVDTLFEPARPGRSRQDLRELPASPTTLLHVYDNGLQRVQAINRLLDPLNMGIFHCGIEVYGQEWSFSEQTALLDEPTGVFCCYPTQCRGYTYLESVSLGDARLGQAQVQRAIEVLETQWPKCDYHVLRKNCYHFCDEFATVLGVDALPDWVTNLARKALQLSEMVDNCELNFLVAPCVQPTCCSRQKCALRPMDPHEADDGDHIQDMLQYSDEQADDVLDSFNPGSLHKRQAERISHL